MLTSGGDVIAEVPAGFFAEMAREGRGRLRDGRLLTGDGWRSPAGRDYAAVLTVHLRRYPEGHRNRDRQRVSGITVVGGEVKTVRAYAEVPAARIGLGYGVLRGIPLEPFKTLAADLGGFESSDERYRGAWSEGKQRYLVVDGKTGLVPTGTRVYVRQLDGVMLPNGKRHDGWLVVNDTRAGTYGAHFDVFVGDRQYGKELVALTGGPFVDVWFDGIEARVPAGYDHGFPRGKSALADIAIEATPHAVEVEIQINNTSAATDDMVRVRSTAPAERPTVACRIRLVGTAATAQSVVLTNPDGRLRFPAAADTTKAVTLPANGDWVAFDLSGETVSAALGDARIEVHSSSATGALIGTKDLTVFEVQVEINHTPAVDDDIVPLHTTTPPHRPVIRSRARIAPAAPAAISVLLTNPDGRLRFPSATDTTLALRLAAGGAWSNFEISGETISGAVGDAQIEVHRTNAAGPILGRRSVTVIAIQVEINNTPAVNDDIVQLHCTHPAQRPVVHSRLRIAPAAPAAIPVLLTNPDGRLRFPDPAHTTLAVTLAANGAWSTFDISGQTASAAIGDAHIQVHRTNASGVILGRRDVTVFHFDSAHMDLTQGGNYTINGGNFTVAAGVAVNFSASAALKPAGLDCAAPQIANLRIGIMQESRNFIITTTWDTPTIAWAPGVAPGFAFNVPAVMRETITYAATVAQPVNDGLAGAYPLYSQQAGALMPPTGCTGSGAATSSDTPGQGVAPTFSQTFANAAGPIGVVTWNNVIRVTRTENFRTFCVVFNTVTNDFCNLRQATWALNANSNSANQHATVSGDAAPTVNPATGVQANNAANTTVHAAVAAATHHFVHP
ncbi:MAG TPA: hypothetical protein VF516_20520 [Kofleriaceae bacterium]